MILLNHYHYIKSECTFLLHQTFANAKLTETKALDFVVYKMVYLKHMQTLWCSSCPLEILFL